MKSPREILLRRHGAAESKLDAVRQEALKAIMDSQSAAARKSSGFRLSTIPGLLWRELILPYRGIWAALAASWVIIFALNFSSHDTSLAIAEKPVPPSPEMLAALQNQKRLFAELLSDGAPAADADRPKPFRPSPHSELLMPVVIT
jgi:hypothetical protein